MQALHFGENRGLRIKSVIFFFQWKQSQFTFYSSNGNVSFDVDGSRTIAKVGEKWGQMQKKGETKQKLKYFLCFIGRRQTTRCNSQQQELHISQFYISAVIGFIGSDEKKKIFFRFFQNHALGNKHTVTLLRLEYLESPCKMYFQNLISLYQEGSCKAKNNTVFPSSLNAQRLLRVCSLSIVYIPSLCASKNEKQVKKLQGE